MSDEKQYLVPRLQEYMRVRVGEDGIERAELWATIAEEAAALSGHLRQAELEGYYSKPHATTFCSSFGCQREVAFSALGYEPSDPMGWRPHSIFTSGYLAEIKLRAMLARAGVEVQNSQDWILDGWVTPEGHQIYVHPDGLIEIEGERACLELKSIASKGFYAVRDGVFEKKKPGYYDQAQLEMAGANCGLCIVLLENKDTQDLLEVPVQFDKRRYDELYWLFYDIFRSDALQGNAWAFPRACEPEDVTIYQPGKAKPITPGAIPRKGTTKTGAEYTYAWDIPTGEKKLPDWPAGYCPYRKLCFAEYRIEERAGDLIIVEKEVVF